VTPGNTAPGRGVRRLAVGLIAAAALPAAAHGFGQRYDLPLPLTLYLCGAALTVAVSCVMLMLFVRRAPTARDAPGVNLLAFAPGRALVSPVVVAVLRLAAVALYLLVLAAGFFGNPSPFRNFVPLGVWALWWVGMAYVSALVIDLWRVVDPLDTIFAAAERAWARMSGGRMLVRGLRLPTWVGAWPAVALYLVFQWMELVWEGTDSPRQVAIAISAYSLVTWIGMALFGRSAWLGHGEVFTRVFGVLARFAPLEVALDERRRVARLALRPYAVGLLAREPVHPSEIALVVLILSGVSFDGFLETPAWAALAEAWPGGGDGGSADFLRSAGLVAAPLIFLAVYLVFSYLIARCGATRGSPFDARIATRRVAGLFVLTLAPIAIAYQFAHYLSYLVTASQYMISIASDPFGWGWNLFGTVTHLVHPNIIDARLVWITSVIAIVAGHVAALWLGHLLAVREFAGPRAAARSQWPMLALMVGYTMLSLWIIAQPIVTTR
jgi:hypothetical protein